ncbi:uncharacterized protein LOC105385071 isoform X2 [Plutella xylostella]|uniref:uncharacterized protein LOC105385071 isoform X2 n=2 Tax=Plutella xylostella TaxID=51655 RepID=UPI0020321D03|nr:uncharacterized protein LOC105385071 isoform X2 [Plutella xylostella]
MASKFGKKGLLLTMDGAALVIMKLFCILLLAGISQGLQLESQASTRRPRVTKYSKTTVAPGGPTEPATERALSTATYRLQGPGGETCILLTVDALIDISYVTKLNERADANTFVPNSAKVDGTCRDGDAETFALSFKEFTLEWTFEKTPGGERWYCDNLRLTYNSSARILEHAAKQGRRVTLAAQSTLLFPTPVGKSFFCPEETVIDLIEGDATNTAGHRAKLYLRQMRLQAFMFKRDGEFGPPWHCSDSARARSETAPVAVGAALALATAGTLLGYAVWRYVKVKKVQYDTMEPTVRGQ